MCSARLYCNKRGAKINKYIEKYVDRRRPVLGEASGIRDAGRNINVGQSKSGMSAFFISISAARDTASP
jgi:hypothetical protein